MKLFVNGDEVDFKDIDAPIVRLPDRLMVQTPEGAFSAVAVRRDGVTFVSFKGHQYRVEERRSRTRSAVQAGNGELRAPMPGQIVDIRHSVGDQVRKGDTILVLEAMKTQQPFLAPFDGEVTLIAVNQGEQVLDGAILGVVKPLEPKDV